MKKNFYFFLIINISLVLIGLLWSIKQDEGVFLTIARFWDGKHFLYRDWFDHKPPGIYLFLWPFAKYIQNIIFYRFLMVLVNCLTAFLVYKIILVKKKHELAIFGGMLYFWLALIFQGFLIETEPFMALCLMSGIYIFMKWLELKKNHLIFFVGIFAGLSVIFKQPALINVLVFLIVISYVKSLRLIIYYLTGFLIIILLIVIIFGQKIGYHIFFDEVFKSNVFYRTYFSNEIIIPIIIASPIIYLVVKKVIEKLQHKWTLYEALVIFSIYLVLPIIIFRTYPHYWLQVLPFMVILVGQGLVRWQRVIFTIMGLSILWYGFLFTKYELPKLREQNEIVRYIRITPGKCIYATRNFAAIYFLTNKAPAGKYLYINEINRPDGSLEKTLISLERTKPQYVVWIDNKKYWLEPYAWDVSKYIEENYVAIKKYSKSNLVIYKLANNNSSVVEPTPVGIK